MHAAALPPKVALVVRPRRRRRIGADGTPYPFVLEGGELGVASREAQARAPMGMQRAARFVSGLPTGAQDASIAGGVAGGIFTGAIVGVLIGFVADAPWSGAVGGATIGGILGGIIAYGTTTSSPAATS
jgi:hypothetical protein